MGSGLGGAAGVCESMAHGLLTDLQRESKLPPQPPSHCGLVALDTGMQGASCWHGPTSGPHLALPAPGDPLRLPSARLSQSSLCGVECVEAQGSPCASCSGLSPPCTASEDSGVASSHRGSSGPWAALVSPWVMGWAMGERLGWCVCLEVSFLGRFLAARQAPHALHCAHGVLSSPSGGFLRGTGPSCECECECECPVARPCGQACLPVELAPQMALGGEGQSREAGALQPDRAVQA